MWHALTLVRETEGTRVECSTQESIVSDMYYIGLYGDADRRRSDNALCASLIKMIWNMCSFVRRGHKIEPTFIVNLTTTVTCEYFKHFTAPSEQDIVWYILVTHLAYSERAMLSGINTAFGTKVNVRAYMIDMTTLCLNTYSLLSAQG